MPPISTNLANKGYVTVELVQHYGARTRGGVGLIVSEVVTVEPTYVYLPGDMSIHDDSFIPGWEKLCAEVHKYGTKILAQLFRPAYMAFPIPGTPQLIAHPCGSLLCQIRPPVTKEERRVLVRRFGEAAKRVQKAGGDGVEIHAAHAHGLLGGFLSPLYNKRCDEYGGTTIKRGSSIPAPGTKMGTHSELAAHIKKRVHVPVATVGRITEAWLAEEMIANGMADACMIGRANLCEPEFANKARKGREHETRPCIGCLRCLN